MSTCCQVREEWTPIIDDKYQMELIDIDAHRPVAVAEVDILIDEVHWRFRSQNSEPAK